MVKVIVAVADIRDRNDDIIPETVLQAIAARQPNRFVYDPETKRLMAVIYSPNCFPLNNDTIYIPQTSLLDELV